MIKKIADFCSLYYFLAGISLGGWEPFPFLRSISRFNLIVSPIMFVVIEVKFVSSVFLLYSENRNEDDQLVVMI